MSKTPGEGSSPAERGLLEGLLHYFDVVLGYKVFIVSAGLLASLLILAFSWVSIRLPPQRSPLPNYYASRAVLLLQPTEGAYLSRALLGSEGAGYEMGQVALRVLHSFSLLDRLAEELNVRGKYQVAKRTSQRRAILSRTSSYYDEKTAALIIQYTDIDPAYAQAAVNRMVDLLDELLITENNRSKATRTTVLQQKLAEVSVRIKELEEIVMKFQKDHDVVTAEQLGTFETRLIADLRSQLVLKDLEIKNYSEQANIVDPVLKGLTTERKNILSLIQQIEQGTTDLGTVGTPIKDLPELAQEFSHLYMELNQQRAIYNSLSEQYELQKLSGDTGSAFQVLERAEASEEKTGPNRGQICVVTVLLTVLASVVLALAHNGLRGARTRMRRLSSGGRTSVAH